MDEDRARTVLFVCTGNTCRSPMAEAIGRHLLRARDDHQTTMHIFSAGTGAAYGMPATAEAIEAVRRLGMTLESHRSTALTPEMIRGADAIYAMTRGHIDAMLLLAPDAASRIHLLDPAGNDIPDPLGYPQPVYDETARRILEAIQSRLEDGSGDAGL